MIWGHRIALVALGLSLVGPQRVAGWQTHSLRGVISNVVDGRSVPGASVSVGEVLVVADEDGGFVFDVPRGSHRLTVTAPGYHSVEFEFTVTGAMPTVIDIGLVELQPLPTVDVHLTGNVHDSGSTLPVSNAEIFVAGESQALTDATGAFSTRLSLTPGVHVVLVRAVGYRLIGYELSVSDGGPVAVDVDLPRAPVTLAGIEVVERDGVKGLGGFLERMESQIGQFLTPADLERLRRESLTTSEMLARVPGIMVRPTRHGRVVALARCGRPELFLDGQPVEADEIDDVIPVEHIAAVEIYSDPGRIPPQFNRLQPRRGATNYGACGAILFWTMVGLRDGA